MAAYFLVGFLNFHGHAWENFILGKHVGCDTNARETSRAYSIYILKERKIKVHIP